MVASQSGNLFPLQCTTFDQSPMFSCQKEVRCKGKGVPFGTQGSGITGAGPDSPEQWRSVGEDNI